MKKLTMPLNYANLANEFESAWKAKNPSEMVTAIKEAKAISAFIDSGITAMGGVPTSAPMIPVLANELAGMWQSKLPNEDLVGKQEAKAIHGMIMGTMTAGGKHGVGGFMSGSPAGLANELASLYKQHLPAESLAAIKKAKAIDSYVKSCIFRGSGVGPDYIPDISSLS
ncbi:MAG: hypothetical protein MJE63_32920 [Proteobacteria bacterium]|nr:hypothetical protein [Pseudomonadota bacterium]